MVGEWDCGRIGCPREKDGEGPGLQLVRGLDTLMPCRRGNSDPSEKLFGGPGDRASFLSKAVFMATLCL